MDSPWWKLDIHPPYCSMKCWPPQVFCKQIPTNFYFFHRHPEGMGAPGISKIETPEILQLLAQLFGNSSPEAMKPLAVQCENVVIEKWRCLNNIFATIFSCKEYLPICAKTNPWIPVFTRFYSPLPRICVSILGGDGSWLAWLWRPLACASSPSFAPWPIWKEGGTWWVNLEDHPSY